MSRVSRRHLIQRTAFLGLGFTAGLACAPASPSVPAATPVPASPSTGAGVAASPTSSAVPANSTSLAAPSAPAAASPPPQTAPSAVAQTYHVHAVWPALTSKALIWAVALEAGYFDKYGVDLQLDYLNGSSATAAGLISGSVDMAATTGSGVVNAQAAGQDLIMLAGFINQDVYRVMARPEIATIDDLKGKAVSVSRIGQSDYLVWQSILEKLGWSSNDIQYVQGNDQAGEESLLAAGQTSAIATTPPLELEAAKDGAHQVLDTTTMGIADQDVGFVVTRAYFAQNREPSLAVLKASIEAIRRWQTDQSFTQGVIAKYLKLTDPDVIQDGWSAYAPIWAKEPFPTRDGLAKIIQAVAVQVPAAAQLTVDQLIDTSLVQQVVDSGFIDQVYGV